MQGQFEVNLLELRKITQDFETFTKMILNYKEELSKVKSYLNRVGFQDLQESLIVMEEQQQQHANMMGVYKTALAEIINTYEATEKKLIGESNEDSKEVVGEEKEEQVGEENFFSGIGDSLKQDLFSSMLEAGGNSIVSLAGLINTHTAIGGNAGPNGFIMLDPNVSNKTGNMVKWGTRFSKYGVPIIGSIIDLTGQLKSGEGAGHAAIKTGIHTAVGIGVGVGVDAATGAILGATFGSTVPVVGTAVGAVAGFVVGGVITFVVNKGIDEVYDNYIKEPLNNAYETVKDAVSDTIDSVGNAIDDVGEAIGNAIDDAGEAIGDFFDDIGSAIFG